jgi:hypothetical protein
MVHHAGCKDSLIGPRNRMIAGNNPLPDRMLCDWFDKTSTARHAHGGPEPQIFGIRRINGRHASLASRQVFGANVERPPSKVLHPHLGAELAGHFPRAWDLAGMPSRRSLSHPRR